MREFFVAWLLAFFLAVGAFFGVALNDPSNSSGTDSINDDVGPISIVENPDPIPGGRDGKSDGSM